MSNKHWTDTLSTLFVVSLAIWAVVSAVIVLDRIDGDPCPANPSACDTYASSKRAIPFGSNGQSEQEKQIAFRDEYRAEKDLIAQQSMASSTWWIMIATWISLLVLVAAAYWARKAAMVGVDTVDVTNEMGQRQLRAYVTLTDAKIEEIQHIKTLQRFLTIEIVLTNSGSTPAYASSTWIGFADVLPKDSIAPDSEPTPLSARAGFSVIGPGSKVQLNHLLEVDNTQLEGMRSGNHRLFIAGGIDFIDAFEVPRSFVFRCKSTPGQTDQNGRRIWSLAPRKSGYDAN